MCPNDSVGWNIALQNYLKKHPNETAADVDPAKVVEYIKVNQMNVFDSNDNLNGYVVTNNNQDIVFQTKSGGFIDFNLQTGEETSGTRAQLLGGDDVTISNDQASVKQYGFNGEPSATQTDGHIIKTEVGVNFASDTYDSTGANKSGDNTSSTINTVKNAINTYVAKNGTPSTLRDVFGVNDPNILFLDPTTDPSNGHTIETMWCVQNGEAYNVQYDATAKTTTMHKQVPADIGMRSGDVGVNYSIGDDGNGNRQLTYSYDWSRIDMSKAADQTDAATAITRYASAYGQDNVDLTNIFGNSDANHIYSSDKQSMIYTQPDKNNPNINDTYYTHYDSSRGTVTTTQVTAANANQLLGTNIPSDATGVTFSISQQSNQDQLTYVYTQGAGSLRQAGTVGSEGDPHFEAGNNGAHAFDFQGAELQALNGGNANQGNMSINNYTLLNNNDMNITGHFGTSYTQRYNNGNLAADGATVITNETITFKNSGISVNVDNNSGTANHGVIIKDSNGNIITLAQARAIDPSFNINTTVGANQCGGADAELVITDGDRTIDLYQNRYADASIDNRSITAQVGDTGLLSQTQGATSGASGVDRGQYMVHDSTELITSAPVMIFSGDNASTLANNLITTLGSTSVGDKKGQMLAMLGGAADGSCPAESPAKEAYQAAKALSDAINALPANGDPRTISNFQTLLTNWISASSTSMLHDINSSHTSSIASRFGAGHGYSTSQWNEFFGTIENAAGEISNNDGTKGIMVNGTEKNFLVNPDNLFSSSGSV